MFVSVKNDSRNECKVTYIFLNDNHSLLILSLKQVSFRLLGYVKGVSALMSDKEGRLCVSQLFYSVQTLSIANEDKLSCVFHD